MPSLSPRDVQTGASVDNGHMLSDGTNHRRILKETEKQSGRVAIVATIVWVGIAWRAPVLSPRKCSFWTPSPNERLPASSISRPPNPSLACSRALRSITSSNREAALRACCALLSIIHLRLHNHCNIPVPYLLEKSHQCSGGYLRNQRHTHTR